MLSPEQQAQLLALVNSFVAGNATYTQADLDAAVASAVSNERARISTGFSAMETQEATAIAALINNTTT